MADLLTFTEYLHAVGKSPSELDDQEATRIEGAIATASDAVRKFTDRQLMLNADAVQGTREFRYLGHGSLEIDDCTTINTISTKAQSFASSRTLDPTEWYAFNEVLPVIDYVEFFTRFAATGLSPEMGFQRNLDNYPFVPYPTVLVVNAVWGWPSIPPAVKQAAVWTTAAMLADPNPYFSESIAGFSRSYAPPPRGGQPGGPTPGSVTQALPDRAIALLDPYLRWPV